MSPRTEYAPKRKALLIGVKSTEQPLGNEQQVIKEYHEELGFCPRGPKRGSKAKRYKPQTPSTNIEALRGPHHDVQEMAGLLTEKYKYQPTDITILIDDNDDPHLQPTLLNIIRQIKAFVRDAQEGDRFVFHFAGHAAQAPTDDLTEDDGLDEYILTSDGFAILDNVLKAVLVDPLPVGSYLTAFFDCCHSCTLLDLPHHRCNRVYVPWQNKGLRHSKTQQATLVRRDAIIDSYLPARSRSGEAFRPGVVKIAAQNSRSKTLGRQEMSVETLRKNRIPSIPASWTETWPSISHILTEISNICDSPIGLTCSGLCRDPVLSQSLVEKDTAPSAYVICLSASKDSQLSWEDENGHSMTQYLVRFLRETQHPTLRHLLRTVSHDIHTFYVKDLHEKARQFRKRNRVASPALIEEGSSVAPAPDNEERFKPEMHNFQEPQLSSHLPLDMESAFDP